MFRLTCAICLLLLAGCGKDKDGFSILGKWKSVADYNGNTAWGGCSCWKDHSAAEQHTIEFRLNGTYSFTQPLLASAPGCSGDYKKTSDSTLSWNRCGVDIRTFYLSYEASFLVIEERQAGGPVRIKYKRL